MKILLLALASTFTLGGTAFADAKLDTEAAKTTLTEGLKLIRDGKFDDWMSKYCSKDKLCLNDNSRNSLKRYNLPATARRAKHCVKADGTIKVTRVNELSPTEAKFFVQCEETAMPVPFHVGVENGKVLFFGL